MNLFGKALLALLLITFFFSNEAYSADRVVTWQKMQNTADEFNPLDALHKGLLALGPFDAHFVEDMDNAAIAQFKAAYGIDFKDPSQAIYDPSSGIYALLDGSMLLIPYLNNPESEDVYVTSDSENPDRAGKWIQISFGRFVVFLSDGIFSASSPNNGAQFKEDNLWFYGYSAFVKKGSDYTKKKNLELVNLMSYQLGQQFENQWTHITGFKDILVPMSILDKESNIVGFVTFPSSFFNIPQGADSQAPYAMSHGYYQWPGINALSERK